MRDPTFCPWLDAIRLSTWLSKRLHSGNPVTVTRMARVAGGASAETFRFCARFHGELTDRELILRRDPVGGLVERDIELEYRVMEALADGPVPVPRVCGLELDPEWLERPFFVDEAVPGTPGPITASEIHLLGGSLELARRALGADYIANLAALHRLNTEDARLQFLSRPGSGSDPAFREVSLWEELVRRNNLEPSPLLAEAFIWLRENLPVAPRISLVHGEYRPGNFLRYGTHITALLDWEYAHLGDPTEDIGWSFLRWYRSDDLECGYFRRKEFLEQYTAISGIEVDPHAARFWELFSNVKVLAIILTGQKRFQEKTMDTLMIDAGKGQHLANEIVRLIEI